MTRALSGDWERMYGHFKLAREPAPEGRPERTGTFTSEIVS